MLFRGRTCYERNTPGSVTDVPQTVSVVGYLTLSSLFTNKQNREILTTSLLVVNEALAINRLMTECERRSRCFHSVKRVATWTDDKKQYCSAFEVGGRGHLGETREWSGGKKRRRAESDKARSPVHSRSATLLVPPS